MQKRLQQSNMVLLSTHNQQRKEQRERLEWLPNEQQEFSNVLMFPYDQIWIYWAFFFFFCSLQKSLADSAAGTISSIFGFLWGISSLRRISDNCCSVMGWGCLRGLTFGQGLLFRMACICWHLQSSIFTPFSGSGERVCLLPAAPVDRSHLWLQAAGAGSCQGPQRFLLPDLRRGSQPELHRRPHAQRGKPDTWNSTGMFTHPHILGAFIFCPADVTPLADDAD